jgi:hypothetical protein
MSNWVVHDTESGNKREFESRSDAENAAQDLRSLADDRDNIEINEVQSKEDVVDVAPAGANDNKREEVLEKTKEHASKPDLNEDPVDWMPSHFVDEIQGVPTLNRKGYAVMAERFNVSVTSEPVVRASETGHEHAEFQATAVTEDGTEYSGFGSAHVDRGDGDDKFLLNELAETRAMKRAVSWATGIGMTAREEMENTL